MISLLWTLLYKVFAFVLAGAVVKRFAGGRGEKVVKVFIWISLYVLIPGYMFLTTWANPLSFAESWKIAACAFAVVISGALFARIWTLTRKISFQAHCLPVIFMNSAYLAIPVSTLLWGARGASYVIIYNIVVTIMNFTLGIWWASKDNPAAEIAGLPVLYAAMAGMVLNVMGAGFPLAVEKISGFVAFITLPVMLVFVGYRLGGITKRDVNLVFWGVSLRMFGGFMSGTAVVFALGLRGAAAGVCVLTSSMPAAVYAYILTEKYEGNVQFAAAAVFAGTVLSFFTIAILGYYFK